MTSFCFVVKFKNELNCLIDGATIYYTLDGSEPSRNSLIYNGSITITSDTIVKAIAVKDGLANSDVVTYTYTIKEVKPSILDYSVAHKKTSSYYKFYITFDDYVDDANLHIALYDSKGILLSMTCEPCEGDKYYIISVPVKQSGVICKTFVWTDKFKPITHSKSVELE